ncbi:MAG: hypothetical protein R6X25_13955 [Candidatus Krumholzibacteriia bacterium]
MPTSVTHGGSVRPDGPARLRFQPGAGNPAAHDPRLRRINRHLEHEEYDQAEPLLTRHLREHPKDHEALASLAILLAGRGRLLSAEKAARKAVFVAPKAVAGHFALACVYLQGSRLEAGFRSLTRARELEPDDPRLNLGLERLEYGRPPVISRLPARNVLNRGLGWVRVQASRERRAVLAVVALLTALVGIAACSHLPG